MDFNWDMNGFGTMTAPLLSEQTGQWNVEPGASWTFLTAFQSGVSKVHPLVN